MSRKSAGKKLSEKADAFKRGGALGVGDYDKYWEARKEVGEIPHTIRDQRIIEEVRKAVTRGGTILDLGVGPGYYFRSLMEDYEMHGVEISGKMIESYGFDTSRITQCDLNKTFPNFEFQLDGVIASMIFHHMDDPNQLARNIFDALKSKGLLVVAAPNIWHIKNRLRVLRGSSPRLSPAHRNFLTPKELSSKIESVGFRLLKILPGRPSQNGGLAWLWPSLGAGQLILLFQKNGS
ncbi:MAG: class I SAM-dependent methyltransferase [Candidatus Binatia bacterium]